MKNTFLRVGAGTAATFLSLSLGAAGHALIVDVDVATPGIQSIISVLPGTVVPVDIYIVDDGLFTPVTGYGMATNYNDTPGVLALTAPTVAGPIAAGVLTPLDLGSGLPTGAGIALAPLGVPAFGAGPGGPFTASNGGTGYYDGTLTPAPGATIPFPLPGFLGGAAILESMAFTAVGPIGSSSDIAPLGILAPGLAGPVPPILGPFGLEFYDQSAGTPGSPGSYPAAPVGPFGPNASFPLGSLGLAAITPGTIRIIPEPSTSLLGLIALTCLIRRRIRP